MGRGVWISGLGRNVGPSLCSGKFLRVVLKLLRRIGGDRQGGVCIRRQGIHLRFGDFVLYRDLIVLQDLIGCIRSCCCDLTIE